MKSFIPLSFRLTPHALRLTLSLLSLAPLLSPAKSRCRLSGLLRSLALLFLCFPAVVHAQWEPDRRLTFNDSASYTSDNNAWCVAASGDTVHVVWDDFRIARNNPEIYYRRSMDGGVTWGSEVRLTYADSASTYPSVAVLGADVHVVWCDAREGVREVYYKHSPDGGTSWDQDLRLTSTTSYNPSVTAEGSNVHVVWADTRNGSTIYYRQSTDRGISWNPEVSLTSVQYSSAPSVASFGGRVYAVWSDNMRLYLARSTDGGTTWRPDTCFVVSPAQAFSPSIAVSETVVHVAWSDNRYARDPHDPTIYYKRSIDSGVSWGMDTCLLSSGFYSSWYPSLAASGDNVHLVCPRSWPEGSSFIGSYLHSANRGADWLGETRLTDHFGSYSVAASGSMVHVVWDDDRDRPSFPEIYYKRNPTGNSGVEVFEVPSSVSHLSFSIHPNPFTSYSKIPGHEEDRFALYDISGRLVGKYKGDRVGEGLAAGVYFLKPEGKEAKPLRIIKLR